MKDEQQRLWGALDKRVPFARTQVVRVTFSSAHLATDIKHDLDAPTPDDIQYLVIRASGPGVVYEDMSGTRAAWQSNYIILKCSEAITVDLLLMVLPT